MPVRSFYLPFAFPFCRKTECILPQNGMHFAAKRNAFCRKIEIILAQNELRLAQNRK